MDAWLFWPLASVSIVAALLVVAQRSATRGVLWTGVMLGATAGLYLLLSAPLAALVQIVLYTTVLLLLVVPIALFVDLPDDVDGGPDVGMGAEARRAGIVLAAVLLAELVWALRRLRGAALSGDAAVNGTAATGLMTDHLGSVALAGLLVVVTTAGALLLVRREAS